VFLVNVPVGIAALAAGWRRLPVVPGHAIERPDPLGVVLVTAGVGLLTLGLVTGPDWGWGSARTGSALAAAVVLLGLFALHCRRSRTPLVHPELFHVSAAARPGNPPTARRWALTRDPRRYRAYFPRLELITPSEEV
jgi:hypothetical protein